MALVNWRSCFGCAALLPSVWLGGCRGIVGTEEKEYVPSSSCAPVASECPPGFADCDGCSDNGCEIDIANDAANCGRCERSCLGQSCGEGMCAPEVLSTQNFGPYVYHLGLDESLLYIPGNGTLLTLPKAGGTLANLLPEGGEVGDVVSRAGYVYYVRVFGGVFVTTPSGAPSTTLATFPAGLSGNPPNLNSVRVDDENVYVASHEIDGFLGRVPIGGGEPTILSSGSSHYFVDLDDTNVYVIAGGELKKIDKLSSATSVLESDVSEITSDESHVYFTTLTDELARIPKLGGTAELLSTQQIERGGLHVDETRVYWRTPFTIESIRKDGSQSQPNTLATDQPYDQSSATQIDETYVYWLGKQNWLYRTPK